MHADGEIALVVGAAPAAVDGTVVVVAQRAAQIVRADPSAPRGQDLAGAAVTAAGDDRRGETGVAKGGGEVEPFSRRRRCTTRPLARVRAAPAESSVQSRPMVRWLVALATSATRRSAQCRSEVSSRRRARVGDEEGVVVRPVLVEVARPPLAVLFQELADELRRPPRRRGALEAEADQIHSRQAAAAEGVPGEHGVVADRYAVLVQAVLEAPQPEGARSDQARRLLYLRDLEVLAAQRRAGRVVPSGEQHQRLAFVRRPVAVLGEQDGAVGGGVAERDQ